MEEEKVFTTEELYEMMEGATRSFFDKAFMFEQLFGTPTFKQRQSNLVVKMKKLLDKESKKIDEERKKISKEAKSNNK